MVYFRLFEEKLNRLLCFFFKKIMDFFRSDSPDYNATPCTSPVAAATAVNSMTEIKKKRIFLFHAHCKTERVERPHDDESRHKPVEEQRPRLLVKWEEEVFAPRVFRRFEDHVHHCCCQHVSRRESNGSHLRLRAASSNRSIDSEVKSNTDERVNGESRLGKPEASPSVARFDLADASAQRSEPAVPRNIPLE